MNDDYPAGFGGGDAPPGVREDDHTLGASTIFKLCAEVIQLRERNDRTHKDFERTLAKTRDELKSSFDSFAAATQRAYQQLRQETVGEKKFSMDLLMLLLEVKQDLEEIVAHRPSPDDKEAFGKWAEAIEVESRKVAAFVKQKNVQEYDPQPGTPYNPALHKRVGSERVDGMGPLLVARVVKRGYASQQPDFVLQRAEVTVTE
jgi:molecular chaperone GrpE (heat shock protein)